MIELFDDYRVYLVKLPATVRGAVRIDNDGFASIYINEQLSPQAKKAAFLHELRHLRNDDMYNDKSIYEVEGLCQGQKNNI
jgi:hypothetical protein